MAAKHRKLNGQAEGIGQAQSICSVQTNFRILTEIDLILCRKQPGIGMYVAHGLILFDVFSLSSRSYWAAVRQM